MSEEEPTVEDNVHDATDDLREYVRRILGADPAHFAVDQRINAREELKDFVVGDQTGQRYQLVQAMRLEELTGELYERAKAHRQELLYETSNAIPRYVRAEDGSREPSGLHLLVALWGRTIQSLSNCRRHVEERRAGSASR